MEERKSTFEVVVPPSDLGAVLFRLRSRCGLTAVICQLLGEHPTDYLLVRFSVPVNYVDGAYMLIRSLIADGTIPPINGAFEVKETRVPIKSGQPALGLEF